jgi:hypothetical protein
MKELFVMWKWKLLVTVIVTVFFTLPIILNWDKVEYSTLLLIYTVMPTLTWISVTIGLYQSGKDFKKEHIKSRYATKTINPDLYSTIKVTANEVVEMPLSEESNNGPYLLGHIDFLDIKVPVYHDKYMDDNINKAIASWQARNPNAFYTGPVFMNWETGKMTYPDDVNPPEPKHEDYEMLPKFVAVGFEELTTENKTGILNYFAKEYMRRNKSWLENGK